MESINHKTQLSLQDTNVLKGFALILLLIHHLFYVQNGLYDDIHLLGDRYLVQQIGCWSKVCVAIFVFLSGYGLMSKAMSDGGISSILHFYWCRFVKLFMNYWFIWLIFVPIGVFVFGRTFDFVYGEHIVLRLILDFFGLLNCFGLYGYNPTWWFYSCIIVLYLSFPFLFMLMEKNQFMIIPVVFLFYYIPIPQILGIKVYFASFLMGMTLCKYGTNKDLIQTRWWFLIFAILSFERIFASDVFLLDSAIVLSLVLSYKSIALPNFLIKILSFWENIV